VERGDNIERTFTAMQQQQQQQQQQQHHMMRHVTPATLRSGKLSITPVMPCPNLIRISGSKYA
jgi:hypothetical protein